MTNTGGLGRRVPTDWQHVEKYPFSAVAPKTVTTVNKILRLPKWHWTHDQGAEGACEGFGNSMMMSILNKGTRYDPWWLWDTAKATDEYSDTNPGDDNGTSGRAACEVLRTKGHVLWTNQDLTYGNPQLHDNETPDATQGIQAYRWAQTVDEMRTIIASGVPVAIGVNWYTNFDNPVQKGLFNKQWWIGEGDLGTVRGGHCVCIYGVSDRHQAFRVKNSWGQNYPLVWLPYTTMERLISEQGEVALVTDR